MQDKVIPFMKTAYVWADQSKCVRLHVGAVIFNKRTRHILSVGYNGTVAGSKIHCNDLFDYNNFMVHIDIQEYIDPKCDLNNKSGWSKVTKENFMRIHHEFSELYEVHAEQNAIYNLLKTGTHWDPDDLAIAVTVEPCNQCLKALAALGIKEIIYDKPYDNKHGTYTPMINMNIRRIEWQ